MDNQLNKRNPLANSVLLLLLVIFVFVLPVVPLSFIYLSYPACFTGILILATLSLQKNRITLIISTSVLIVMIWIATLTHLKTFAIVLRIFQFIYFFFLVAGFVMQISNTERVTKTVIIESITGYLLLGFAFALMVTVLVNLDADAYSNLAAESGIDGMDYTTANSIYYTFMTYTTTGYGDIVPIDAMAKSLSVLIGVSGQLYVAIIIAMLVGKYAGSKNTI